MFTLLLLLRIQCCMWRNQWITSRHGLDSDRNLYFKQDLVLNLYYILHIGAGAGKFLGVWRIFDRKIFGQLVLLSPNKRIPFFEVQLREKSSTHVVCCFFKILHTWVPFFEIKQHWAPFVPVFSGSLPRFSGILQRFSQILLRFPLFFAQIFRDFSRIFNKSKLFGCTCTPWLPPPTPLILQYNFWLDLDYKKHKSFFLEKTQIASVHGI